MIIKVMTSSASLCKPKTWRPLCPSICFNTLKTTNIKQTTLYRFCILLVCCVLLLLSPAAELFCLQPLFHLPVQSVEKKSRFLQFEKLLLISTMYENFPHLAVLLWSMKMSGVFWISRCFKEIDIIHAIQIALTLALSLL